MLQQEFGCTEQASSTNIKTTWLDIYFMAEVMEYSLITVLIFNFHSWSENFVRIFIRDIYFKKGKCTLISV
jgi:hypothetical protein